MAIALAVCTAEDAAELAALNRALIDEERYDVAYTDDELLRRMRDFLAGTYTAWFIAADGERAGYILVNRSREPLYIRQFYVKPEYRRRGIGRKAIELLARVLETETLDVEVMIWNEPGRGFWKGIGFRERYVGLRWKRGD